MGKHENGMALSMTWHEIFSLTVFIFVANNFYSCKHFFIEFNWTKDGIEWLNFSPVSILKF